MWCARYRSWAVDRPKMSGTRIIEGESDFEEGSKGGNEVVLLGE